MCLTAWRAGGEFRPTGGWEGSFSVWDSGDRALGRRTKEGGVHDVRKEGCSGTGSAFRTEGRFVFGQAWHWIPALTLHPGRRCQEPPFLQNMVQLTPSSVTAEAAGHCPASGPLALGQLPNWGPGRGKTHPPQQGLREPSSPCPASLCETGSWLLAERGTRCRGRSGRLEWHTQRLCLARVGGSPNRRSEF